MDQEVGTTAQVASLGKKEWGIQDSASFRGLRFHRMMAELFPMRLTGQIPLKFVNIDKGI